MEENTLRAAAQVYGRHGWSGFNFDAVAREAKVGKSTLYARWAGAADLLSYLIEKRWQALEKIDAGSLNSDLKAFSQLVLRRYLETGGGIAWHLRRDIGAYPELKAKVGQSVGHIESMCLDILDRARERGELREGMSLSLVADILVSALESYAVRRSQKTSARSEDDEDYIARVMQLICFGIEPV